MSEEQSLITNSIDTPKNWKWRMFNIIMLGIGFLIIYISYNTTENFMTSLYGNYGMVSLSIIYFTFAVSGFIVPLILRRIGERWCLIIGGFCIIPFLLVNIFQKSYLLIIFSFFVGFGQSLTWCAQGSLLTRCSKPEKRGRNSGIFFFVYQLNQTLGNGFAYVMTLSGLDLKYLFIIFSSLCLIGIIPFLFIKMNVLPEIEKVSLKTDLRSIKKVLVSRNLLLMLPVFIYSGLSQCYIYGEVTAMFGVEYVTIAMCIFGTTNMIISLIFGKLGDTIGKFIVLSISGFVMVLAPVPILLFTAIICIAISDGGFNTQIDALLGKYFQFESDAAFSIFYSVQSLISGLGFPLFIFLIKIVPWEQWYRLLQSIILFILILISLVSVFILEHKKFETKK
ncbi:major facilitator superfamily protein [Entamoeba nuttalli P19]|uniref:UNC93-like protein MFSD11 n=2 Tax=Entamoeba nuttalli TaxID=412467 RepID=K2HXI6_ENTNP|nr:major facilitator superfamily protein [Entamoeba nuttalli P19]EKE41055.1 major facilitator superfamily protein [Entamoeba nuttalli P19]|eukprot:XP_008856607.1 major facilitator superfamily protein [Entamoeba nuttalli P19]